MVDTIKYLKNIPCKGCISLAICICNHGCECEVIDKYIKKVACNPLWPFHPTSLEVYEDLLNEIKRTLRKDWSIRNGEKISFFKSPV